MFPSSFLTLTFLHRNQRDTASLKLPDDSVGKNNCMDLNALLELKNPSEFHKVPVCVLEGYQHSV